MSKTKTTDNTAEKEFKPIKALRDGADFFWDSISSLETGIVNTLFRNNVSDEQQATKPKTSNLGNIICNFIGQIFGINTKVEVEGDADIIAKWKRTNLENMEDQNLSEDKIETLAQETRQKAIDLYRKISGGSETQQEINLITLLHEHRLKLIGEVLSADDKSETEKLQYIKDILENKGDFQQHINLASNIYNLTEANFQPGDDLKINFLLPKAPGNSSSTYPPQWKDPSQDRIILDKETKEELLFRLNDFKYSCLGVLDSGFHYSNQIEALKGLLEEHSAQTSREDFVKKHADLKLAIGGKIEIGVARLEFGLNRKMANESIKEDVENILNQSYPSKVEEDDKAKSILTTKAEDIAESMLNLNFAEIKESFSDFSYAVKQMMYFYTFQQISYARGKELAEQVSKITGDSLTPQSSPRKSRSNASATPPFPKH
jgi:hypothetical protein